MNEQTTTAHNQVDKRPKHNAEQKKQTPKSEYSMNLFIQHSNQATNHVNPPPTVTSPLEVPNF